MSTLMLFPLAFTCMFDKFESDRFCVFSLFVEVAFSTAFRFKGILNGLFRVL